MTNLSLPASHRGRKPQRPQPRSLSGPATVKKKNVAPEGSHGFSAGGAEHLPVRPDIVAPRFIRDVKSAFGFHEVLPCVLPRAEKTWGFWEWGGGVKVKEGLALLLALVLASTTELSSRFGCDNFK